MARWNEQQLRDAVEEADSLSDVLRHFELRAAGGNFSQLKLWLDRWQISTDHFTYKRRQTQLRPNRGAPLEALLVERMHLPARAPEEAGLRRRTQGAHV